MPHSAGLPGVIGWADGVDASLAAFPSANLTGTIDDARLSGTVAHKVTNQFNVMDYGFKGDETVESTTSLYAAITGATGPVEVLFPRASSYYNLTAPLPNISGVTYIGSGTIRVTSGSLLAPTSYLSDVTFRDLALQASGSHLIDLGTTGYLVHSAFEHCTLTANAPGASIVNGSGSAIGYQEIKMRDCDLLRWGTSTVPPFNLVGGALHANVWEGCRASSFDSSSGGPFWHIEQSVAGVYCNDNAWRDITGEQNPAGLIHLWSPYGATFDNVLDWDTTTYTASLIKISKGGGGYPNSIKASNVGNRGGTMGAGVYQIEVTDAADNMHFDRVQDSVKVTKVSTVTGYGAISHVRAWAVPTTGTHNVGEYVRMSIPVVGQPKGWYCTVAGTPGTWVSEGNL